MREALYIGTSGWSYPGWKEAFFAGVPRKDWLRHYAGQFNSVEVNASFYGRLQPRTCEHWDQETPADFRFAIKGSRSLTHVHKLLLPHDALQPMREPSLKLGRKLAVVIWQMPKSLHFDLPRLERFAESLRNWPEVRHALEFRHGSWFCREAADCLRRCHLAVCQSDAADWPLWDAVTTDLVYLRLHGHEQTYVSAYADVQLKPWAERIERWLADRRQVYVYFDNTDCGHAPRDAERLKEMLA